MEGLDQSSQDWDRVQGLFERLLTADDTREILAGEPDAEIARAAEKLYRDHLMAEVDQFLESPITLVRDLHLGGGETEPAISQDRTGETLSHFRILRKLGEGGMGKVYLAEDLTLRRQVALKFVAMRGAVDSARLLERFRREARAAAALKHPHICTIYGVEDCDGQPVIEMEYVEGETLATRLQRASLPLDEALDIAIQVAGALVEAHARGVVHRDLKPANIMLTKFGAKVLDFGLAKMERAAQAEPDPPDGTILETATLTATVEGAVMGTPYYMAPEQASGEPVDGRSDLFSLGIVLYEMTVGKRPFTGENTRSVLAAILRDTPAPPSRVQRKLPRELDRIVGKALAKSRRARYQNAQSFLTDCEEFRKGLELRRSQRLWLRRRWTTLAAAVSVLVMLGLGGWFLFGPKAHALAATDTVILADFRNLTGDAVFDDTLKEALSAELAQSPFLSVLPRQKIMATLNLMAKPPDTPINQDVARDICLRVGSRAYINGSIAKLGSQYVITLQAVECSSTDLMARQQATAGRKEEVLAALDSAGRKLREKVGESLGSVQKFSTPLAEVTTSNLEALKVYSLGVKSGGDPGAAIPLFQWSVRLDPNFAMAHLYLGMAYNSVDEYTPAEASIKTAYELRSRVSEWERFAIESRYVYSVLGDLDRARAIYLAWAKTFPRQATGLIVAAQISDVQGKFEEAIPLLLQAAKLQPDRGGEPLAVPYFALGRLDEARADMENRIKNSPTHSDADCALYQIAFVKRDSQEMAHQAAVAAGKPAIENLMVWFQSLTAAYYGRRSEARDLSRRAHDLATKAGLKDVAAAYLAASAIREVLFGDRAQAHRLAAAAAAESDGHDVAYGNAFALALAGDARGAQRLADNLNRRYPSDTLMQFVDLPIVRAGIAIERKDGAAAVEAVRPAMTYVFGWWSGFSIGLPIYATYLRGEGRLLSKRGPEAAAEFQKILDHPTIVVNEPIGALAHLGMARAYVQQGDKAKGKAKYEDFFALWNQADPDIPILINARKEYARLKQ